MAPGCSAAVWSLGSFWAFSEKQMFINNLTIRNVKVKLILSSGCICVLGQ